MAGYDFSDSYIAQKGENLTDVNIVGVSNKALSGIMQALDRQARLLDRLQKGVTDVADTVDRLEDDEGDDLREKNKERKTREKKDNSELVRSVASDRRQRAGYAAVFGKIDKATSLLDKFKNAFDKAVSKFADLLKDSFNKSLKTYDDMASTFRKYNLSHEDKKSASRLSSRAKNVDGGLTVSLEDTSQFLTSLGQTNSAYLQSLAKETGNAQKDNANALKANLGAVLHKRGYNVGDIEDFLRRFKDDELSLAKDIVLQVSDSAGGSAAWDAIMKMTKTVEGNLAMGKNFAKTASSIALSVRKFSSLGTAVTNDNLSGMVEVATKIASGKVADVDQSAALTSVLGLKGKGNISAENVLDSMTSKLEEISKLQAAGKQAEADALADQLTRALRPLQKDAPEVMNEFLKSVEYARQGNLAQIEVASQAQLLQNNKDNTRNGKWQDFTDTLTAGFDNLTGGMISSLAVNLDEIFAGAITTGDIVGVVGTGFKETIKLLTAIRLGQIAESVFKLAEKLGWLGAGAGTVGAGAAGAGVGAGAGTLGAGAAGAGAAGASGASRWAKAKNGLKAAGRGLKKAGIAGLAVGGVVYLGSKLFGSSDEDSSQPNNMMGVQSVGEEAGDYYSYMSSLVSDIRNAVCHISEDAPLNEHNENLDLIQNIAGSFTSPLEKIGTRMGENFAKKVAPEAVAKATEKAAVKAAEKAAAVTAEKGFSVVAKTGLKAALKSADKVLGPVGAVVDAGISVYEVSQDLAEANRQEQTGKDLTRELFSKQYELNQAKKNNDADAVAKLTLEISSLESAIDEAALAQEEATDQAVVHGVGGASGIGGAMAGAAAGAAIGTVVPVIGNAVGALIGGLIGGIGGMLAGEAAAGAAVADTPEQKAEKVRQKREAYQKELLDRQQYALNKGLSEDIAFALVANTKDEAEFNDRLGSVLEAHDKGLSDNIAATLLQNTKTQQEFDDKLNNLLETQNLNLSEQEQLFIANNAETIEDMKKIEAELLSSPEKFYSNVAAILQNVAAIRKKVVDDSGWFNFFGDGGVVSSTTRAIIGESGKEVVLPLEHQDDMKNVLSELSHNEKLRLLKALLSKKSTITWNLMNDALQQIFAVGQSRGTNQGILDALPKDGVPGDDPATINRILNMAGPYRDVVWKRLKYGWKGNYKKGKDAFAQRKEWFEESKANAANQEGRELIAGTYAERALDFGVSELGKPYILRSLGKIGYVCNELVNACLRASGFDMKKFNFWTVNGTLQEILQGKRSNSKKYPDFRIREDITPETAIPGMVFFQDSKKRKDGSFQPGHIGLVYYGHQRLHSAGGSQSYYPGTFFPKWQTPCRGVTINPFDGGARYLFGEFPGLFEKATGEWSAPTGASLGSYAPFGPGHSGETGAEIRAAAKAEKAGGGIGKEIKARAKEAGLLTDDDINKIIEEAGYNYMPAEFGEYIKAAQEISKNTASKDEIIAILLDIARYLRGAISKPAGGFMSQMTNAVRQGVESNIYGSGSGRSR